MASIASTPRPTRAIGIPRSSATIVEPYSQLSRTIRSGRQSSASRRSPGSIASVSSRPKNSRHIASWPSSSPIPANVGSSGFQSSSRIASTGANGSPVRATFSSKWSCAATSTSCPARASARPNGASGMT